MNSERERVERRILREDIVRAGSNGEIIGDLMINLPTSIPAGYSPLSLIRSAVMLRRCRYAPPRPVAYVLFNEFHPRKRPKSASTISTENRR